MIPANLYKVLVIQLTRMGDIIQTLPLLVRLREEIPGCHITFFCVDRFAEILRATPVVNRYIKIPPEVALKLKKPDVHFIDSMLTHHFFRESYDLLINLTHDMSSGIIANRVKADSKTGAIAEDHTPYLKLKDKWGRYVFSCVNNREENSFNLVDIHIGMGKVSHRPVKNYLRAEARSEQRMAKILPIAGDTPLVAFHMGANKPHRTWPVEHFATLADFLIRKYDACIVLTGSRQEQALFRDFDGRLSPNLTEKGKVINLIGSTKLQDLIALLKRCTLLISNDTGPIHVAAAVGTRTIGIYTATAYPGETAPYGEGHYVVHPTMACYPCLDESSGFPCGLPCRSAISPSLVFELATQIIENRNVQVDAGSEASVLRSELLSNGTVFYNPADAPYSRDGMKEQWINKRLLRILWEGILEIPSDLSIISRISADRILRWIIKARSILHTIPDIVRAGKLDHRESPLINFSSLMAEFLKLTMLSECYEDIPKTVLLAKEKLAELELWTQKVYRSA